MEMLDVPPERNEVPDLMMEEKDVLPEATRSTKPRGDEISRGQKKRRKEDNIGPEKHDICPQYPREYKIQRDSVPKIGTKFGKKKTKAPDTWQRISQMVFCNGVLEIHSVGDGAISSLCTQHLGAYVVHLWSRYETSRCGEG